MPDQLHMNTAKMMSFHNNPPAPLFTQIYRKLKKFKADSRQRKKRMVIDNRWIQSKVLYYPVPSMKKFPILELNGILIEGTSDGFSWATDAESPDEADLFYNEHGVPSHSSSDKTDGEWMGQVRIHHRIKLWQQEDWVTDSFIMKSWKSLLIINWLFVSILYVYSK